MHRNKEMHQAKSNITERLFGLLPLLLFISIFVISVVSIEYYVARQDKASLLDSFIGGLGSTTIGAIVGFLSALQIARWEERQQERDEQETKEDEESARQNSVLTLVRRELDFDRQALLARQQTKDGVTSRAVLVNRLKDDLWSAFSDSGDLKWISDLQTLSAIATAYYHIRMTIYLEERYFEAAHFPGMQIHQEKYPKDYIMDYLTQTDPQVLQSVEKAIEIVDESLQSEKA